MKKGPALYMRNGRNNGDGSEETNTMLHFEKAVMAALNAGE